jgi:hypothetical protein
MVVLGNVVEVIVPLPETTVQLPLPTEGVFAFMVTVVAHTVCEVPAFAMLGLVNCVTETVDVVGGHTPLDIVHWNIFVPKLSPVILVMSLVGVVMEPAPETSDHNPLPTMGVFPMSVAVAAQTDCEAPAVAIVGFASLVIATVEEETGQTPFPISH